jgi:hypothetical protein
VGLIERPIFAHPAQRRLLPPPFRYVESRRRRLRKYLRVLDLDDERQCDLAESLVQCAGGTPCGLSFCPLCIRKLRKRCLSAIADYATTLGTDATGNAPLVTRFSAQPYLTTHAVPNWQLHSLDLDEVHRVTRRHLQALKALAAFAWLNVSLHHDATGDREPFWQVHIEGAVLGLPAAEIGRALQSRWQGFRVAPLPFAAHFFSSFTAAVKDCIKLSFSRYLHRKTRAGRPISRALPVRRNEAQELERFLAAYDLHDRFILLGEEGTELPLAYKPPENQNKYDWR